MTTYSVRLITQEENGQLLARYGWFRTQTREDVSFAVQTYAIQMYKKGLRSPSQPVGRVLRIDMREGQPQPWELVCEETHLTDNDISNAVNEYIKRTSQVKRWTKLPGLRAVNVTRIN